MMKCFRWLACFSVLLVGSLASAQTLNSLTIWPSLSTLATGATLTVSVTGTDSVGGHYDCTISCLSNSTTYSSNNTSVAPVSANVITGVSAGTATITATNNSIQQTIVVTVITTSLTSGYFVGPIGSHTVAGSGLVRVPYSSQSQPAKGSSFTDSTYNVSVKRVTNTATDEPGSFGTITEYPSWDLSSSDGAYLLFTSCDTQAHYQGGSTGCNNYVLYNSSGYTFNANLTTGCGGGSPSVLCSFDAEAPEPRWNRGSGFNSHSFTYRKYMELRQFNVDTQTDTLVHDFMNEFGPSGTIAHIATSGSDTSNTGYLVFCNEYCSPSVNSRYYGLLFANPSTDTYYYALLYDRVLDSVVAYHDISGSNTAGQGGLKGLLLSPSGRYVLVNYFCAGNFAATEFCGVTAYDTQNSWSYVRISTYPDHMGWAYDKQGNEVVVVSPKGTDMTSFVSPATGHVYELFDSAQGVYPFLLWTFQTQQGWAFGASMNTTLQGYTNPTTWQSEGQYGPGQMFALELDETKCLDWYDVMAATPTNPSPASAAYDNYQFQHTGYHNCSSSNHRMWRVAFNQDAIGSASTSYYWMQVNPQINTAGTKIWFGSNWRSANSAPEIYEVDLPSTWNSDLGGGGGTPGFSASPSPIAFGNQTVNITSGGITETITNSGTASLTIGTLSSNDAEFALSSDGCSGQNIGAGSNCTVVVKFTPTSAGTKNATLTVPDNAGNPDTVSMSGTGVVFAPSPASRFVVISNARPPCRAGMAICKD